MKINLNGAIRVLIYAAIVLTPVFSIGELTALFQGTLRNQTTAVTPFYIKLLKDVLLVTCVLLAVLRILIRGWITRYVYLLLVAVSFTSVVVLLTLPSSPLLVAAGLRWLAPLFLAIFLVDLIDKSAMRTIAHLLIGLFVLHVVMQALESLFMSPWYGPHFLFPSLAGRALGIFLIPSTGGFFTVLVVFFTFFFVEKGWIRKLVWFLAPFSVLFTMSGTAIVVAGISVLLFVGGRYYKPLLMAAPVLGASLLYNIAVFTGRDDALTISLGGRIRIFSEAAREAELISSKFGAATNSGVLLGTQLGLDLGTPIVDSTYAAILVNTGLVGSALFLLFGVYWVAALLHARRRDAMLFTIIYALYGASTSVTETFPMNFLFAVGFGYYSPIVYRQWKLMTRTLTGEPVAPASSAYVAQA